MMQYLLLKQGGNKKTQREPEKQKTKDYTGNFNQNTEAATLGQGRIYI